MYNEDSKNVTRLDVELLEVGDTIMVPFAGGYLPAVVDKIRNHFGHKEGAPAGMTSIVGVWYTVWIQGMDYTSEFYTPAEREVYCVGRSMRDWNGDDFWSEFNVN